MALYNPTLANPMTTGGDIIYGGASGVPTRLANGSSGQFLKSNGTTTAPSWAAATATPAYTYVSQATTLNPAVLGSYYLLSGASFPITLPTAASIAGQIVAFEHNGTSLSQVYTFNTTSAQTIGGVASGSYALYTNGEVLELISDGANWQILNHYTGTPIVSFGAVPVSATSAYVFTVTAANATQGATYSNSGQTFIVTTTIAAGLTLTCAGTGTPGASGTLTKVSGTGDATITFASRTITGAPAIAGGAAVNNCSWYRQGKVAHISYKIEQGSGTAGVGNYVLFLPTGLVFDAAIVPLVGSTGAYLGNVAGVTAATIPSYGNSFTGGASYQISLPVVAAYSTTSWRYANVYNAPSAYNWDGTTFGFNTASIIFTLTLVAPISGWQP